MKAIILAAGFGTRLRPLTDHIPKPLLEIGGKPLILHILMRLKAAGITEIVINLHYLGDQIRQYLGDGHQFDLQLHYSHEETILGTGGGIKNAQKWLDNDPFLVYNGDILCDVNLEHFISSHHHQLNAVSTLAVRPPTADQRPTVRVLKDRVVDLRDQLGVNPENSALYYGLGIMICEPVIFQYLKPEFSDVITAFHLPALRHQLKIGAFVHCGYWNDIGTPEALTKARLDYDDRAH